MGDHSAIEWTGATWNPVRGCTKVSPGCKHCYAERFAERFRGVSGHPFEQGFDVRLVPEALELPLRWRKPRSIFVNSMSDLFHEDVSDDYIAAVFGVMAACPRHTFQVLTKRAERARRWFEWVERQQPGPTRFCVEEASDAIPADPPRRFAEEMPRALADAFTGRWPLPNVWLGVSVENQAAANSRIPELLATPAAVRFLSCEPLLGPVDLRSWLGMRERLADGACHDRLHWTIVGGESGPGARPCDVAWVRSLVKQCRATGTACFVKQLGARSVVSPPQGQCPTPRVRDRKGGDPAEWPDDLRIREFPTPTR